MPHVPTRARGGDGGDHVLVRDRQEGRTELVDLSSAGTPVALLSQPHLSASGRFAVLNSAAANLAPGAVGRLPSVFVRDVRTGGIRIASAAPTGPANGGAFA